MPKQRIEIVLRFTSDGGPQLYSIECCGLDDTKYVSFRGRSNTRNPNSGSFLWSPAVYALTIFLTRVAAWRADSEKFAKDYGSPYPILEGEAATPASSLDYALSKQPIWISDMFGFDAEGNISARLLFGRSNPERKRSGPVTICLSPRSIKELYVSLFNGERAAQGYEAIHNLCAALERNWKGTSALTNFTAESSVIAAAKPATTSEQIRSLAADIQDKYKRLWSAENGQAEALNTTASTMGLLWGHNLLTLSFDREIDIFNEFGDAESTCAQFFVNIGKAPVHGIVQQIDFDRESVTDDCEIFAKSEHGEPLRVSIIQNHPNHKLFYCHFLEPVRPRGMVAISHGYRVKGLFTKGLSPNSHYWDLPIDCPTNRISFSVRHRKGKTFKGARVVRTVEGDFMDEPNIGLEVDYDTNELRLSWAREFPEWGSLFRTYWEFHP